MVSEGQAWCLVSMVTLESWTSGDDVLGRRQAINKEIDQKENRVG